MKTALLMVAPLALLAACGPAGSDCHAEIVSEGASGYTYHRTTVYTNSDTGTVRSCTLVAEGPADHVTSTTTCQDVTDPEHPTPYPSDRDPCAD